MMGDMLMNIGYTVKAHQNPEKALDTFKSSPSQFDLIITDMTMPRLNGFELCTAVKKVRRDIPVIICTGRTNQLKSETDTTDIAAVIMKPVTTLEMAQAIRKVLD